MPSFKVGTAVSTTFKSALSASVDHNLGKDDWPSTKGSREFPEIPGKKPAESTGGVPTVREGPELLPSGSGLIAAVQTQRKSTTPSNNSREKYGQYIELDWNRILIFICTLYIRYT